VHFPVLWHIFDISKFLSFLLLSFFLQIPNATSKKFFKIELKRGMIVRSVSSCEERLTRFAPCSEVHEQQGMVSPAKAKPKGELY
jgi:hypothetical protein